MLQSRPATVDLVYFNAGGGHRAAALALQESIRELGLPWQVRLVNLMDLLDPQGHFRRLTGIAPEDVYNLRLKRGWTLGLAQELKLLQGLIRMGHGRMLQTLQGHWLQRRPGLVVSVIPNFNRVLGESVASALPGVPFVTVMTDLADLPPHFWCEPGGPQHLVCGTPHARAQALAAGHAPQQLWQVSGMVLRTAFYRPDPLNRAAERQALGLDPTRPTGVVMFGGQGSMQMLDIAHQLDDVQLILLCGHNLALAQRLLARAAGPGRAAHAVLGFTSEVSQRLRLGDFLIGKPGPGSLSEAVQLGLPVITFDNARTLPQERYNPHWVRANGLGLVVGSVRQLPPAVNEMTQRLDEFQHQVKAMGNRAVFEVPQILARILATAPAATQGASSRKTPPSANAEPAPALLSFSATPVSPRASHWPTR
jgi:processive 1,2-diacylglycerol beta-glucosyltransferase